MFSHEEFSILKSSFSTFLPLFYKTFVLDTSQLKPLPLPIFLTKNGTEDGTVLDFERFLD